MIDNTINDDKTISATRTCFALVAIIVLCRFGWCRIGSVWLAENRQLDFSNSFCSIE